MKALKKIYLAFFTITSSFVLMALLTNISAQAEPLSPWTLSFDNGHVINVNSSTDFTSVVANGFSISYNDTTGKSSEGYFVIFAEFPGLEALQPIYNGYLENKQDITLQAGGRLWLRATHYESDELIYDADFYSFFVDRSIINSNRIGTNYQTGKYFYNNSIYFNDGDYNFNPDEDLNFEIRNLTTGQTFNHNPWESLIISENGRYEVHVTDSRKKESKTFTFAIDNTAPIIQLVEWNFFEETSKLSGSITSYGMKVIYGDNIQVNSMTYEYRPIIGRIEFGTMPNEQIFWRKGHYTITVTDMVGNKTESTFTITDYELIVDPVGATVGTEVTMNKGAYLDTTMHVGYTRCVYLGANANSQSRLDFNFTSSDESIATVSAYGTVTAHGAGTVVITSVHKRNGQIGKIILTVLPK